MRYPSAVFPSTSVCPLDLATTGVTFDQEPVRFYNAGPLDVVEVVGVPALSCPTCRGRTHDLSLLASIEALLKRRTALGPCKARYTFQELVAELDWQQAGAAPAGAPPSGSPNT